MLQSLTRDRKDVFVYAGDCNKVLLEDVFPRVHYNDFRRGLCLFDPYGVHLNWDVIKTAAGMGTIDAFLNFPVSAMNRTALYRDARKVKPSAIERMNRFWGDGSWKDIAYRDELRLFGDGVEKVTNTEFVEAYRERLGSDAGFKYVSEALPMRNTKRSTLYYLVFASQKPVATNIVDYIFDKYRKRGRV
jgi:three-Cys-motif partner protein